MVTGLYETMVETKGKHRRTGIARRIRSAMISLVIVSVAAQGICADTQSGRPFPWRIERDLQRFKTVATDNVMKLLAIRPGMTILDIGAGTGQFAFEFARRLDGTGRVYATDTNDYCVDFMKKEADRRKLNNLHPILVKKDGVDAFYGQHKYDLITVFHVAMPYEDQIAYFRKMKGFLTNGGRLILILYKIPTPFSPGDFTWDFRGLIRELSMEPPESPYYRILKDSTRKRIRDNPAQDPPWEVKSAIAEDFNETLPDNEFFAQFIKGSVFREGLNFLPEERRYADWFLPSYPDSRVRKPVSSVRDKDIRVQKAPGVRGFETINKLLIVQRYRRHLKKDGLFLSGFTPDIKAAFEKAGYRLQREVPDVIPFENIVILTAR